MKQSIAIILGLILYSTPATAQFIGTGDFGSGGRPHPYAINDITSERDFVTIHSDSLINNVHIIIKDDKGNVMYDDTTTIQPSTNIIYVPEEYDNEKYIIEIFYDEEYIVGKLEE